MKSQTTIDSDTRHHSRAARLAEVLRSLSKALATICKSARAQLNTLLPGESGAKAEQMRQDAQDLGPESEHLNKVTSSILFYGGLLLQRQHRGLQRYPFHAGPTIPSFWLVSVRSQPTDDCPVRFSEPKPSLFFCRVHLIH